MDIRSESELYEIVMESFEEFRRRQPKQVTDRYAIDYPVVTDVKQIAGRNVHIVGEEHYSRQTIEYVHQHLASQMTKEPDKWLILKESAHRSIKDPSDQPTLFYLQELAKFTGIPYEPALTSLKLPATREAMVKIGIKEEEIDQWRIFASMAANGVSDTEQQIARALPHLSKELGKPVDYIERLIANAPQSLQEAKDFQKRIMNAQNECSRQHFYRILNEYGSRPNVLVNVGRNHLPIFK